MLKKGLSIIRCPKLRLDMREMYKNETCANCTGFIFSAFHYFVSLFEYQNLQNIYIVLQKKGAMAIIWIILSCLLATKVNGIPFNINGEQPDVDRDANGNIVLDDDVAEGASISVSYSIPTRQGSQPPSPSREYYRSAPTRIFGAGSGHLSSSAWATIESPARSNAISSLESRIASPRRSSSYSSNGRGLDYQPKLRSQSSYRSRMASPHRSNSYRFGSRVAGPFRSSSYSIYGPRPVNPSRSNSYSVYGSRIVNPSRYKSYSSYGSSRSRSYSRYPRRPLTPW